MNFTVKGQEYFLAFVENEGRWFVFTPAAQGLQRIPVYVDAIQQGMRVSLEGKTHAS